MNCSKPINPIYNWHLSAMKISREVIEGLEQRFGFQRDLFVNNTRCETTAYHGTFKGSQEEMTRTQWTTIVNFLASHDSFEGDLEEEIILPQYCTHFSHAGEDANPIKLIEKQGIEPCPIGIYKECDLHLKVDWAQTKESVRTALDGLGMISFDRPTDEIGRFNRVYTLTFESLNDGLSHFEHLTKYLSLVQGLQARLKLEIATCFYRQPDKAIVLPIVRAK